LGKRCGKGVGNIRRGGKMAGRENGLNLDLGGLKDLRMENGSSRDCLESGLRLPIYWEKFTLSSSSDFTVFDRKEGTDYDIVFNMKECSPPIFIWYGME
jgi:hypothetical protein